MEVMKCFYILLSKDSGIKFIQMLNKKVAYECTKWTNALMELIEKLIVFDSGCELIEDLLTEAKKKSIKTNIPYIVIERMNKNDNVRYGYQKLFYATLKMNHDEPSIIQPILDYKWDCNPSTSRLFLAMIIDLIKFDRLTNVVKPFIIYTHTYIHDKYFLDGIIRILSKVNKNDFDIMFGNIVNYIDLFISDELKSKIVLVLCSCGNKNQRLFLFSVLENYIFKFPQLPRHFDPFLNEMLFIMDRHNRYLFITRIQNYIKYTSRALRLHKRYLSRFRNLKFN